MDKLIDAVADFTSELRRADLPEEVAEALPLSMAATRYFSDVGDLAQEIDISQSKKVSSISEEIDEVLSENRRLAISILESIQQQARDEETLIQETATLDSLERSYELVKAKLLRVGTTGKLAIRHMLALIELMKNIERLVNYSVKGQNALYSFSQSVAIVEEGSSKDEDEDSSEGESVAEEGSADEAGIEELSAEASDMESKKNASGRTI